MKYFQRKTCLSAAVPITSLTHQECPEFNQDLRCEKSVTKRVMTAVSGK
jgi:hypothetical protein